MGTPTASCHPFYRTWKDADRPWIDSIDRRIMFYTDNGRPCDGCTVPDGLSGLTLYEYSIGMGYASDRRTYARCASCGTVHRFDMPDDIDREEMSASDVSAIHRNLSSDAVEYAR
jgi:hypothetical protein